MVQIFNANPFAEAMFYYSGRANNKQVKKRLAEKIKQYPEFKETLEKAAKPAVTLEKLLDTKLDADNELINKYFRKFNCDDIGIPSAPFDFFLASVMVSVPLIDHFEYSTDEMCKYLRECSIEKRMYSFCRALTDLHEAFSDHTSGIKELSHRLENLYCSVDIKWKIQSAAFNYEEHINELLSLIVPAAKLIEAASIDYKTAAEDFHKLYSADNAQDRLESYFNIKTVHIGIMKIMPIILGFDCIFATVYIDEDEYGNPHDGSYSICRSFVGIAKHIINRSPQNEIASLSEKLKILSDSTRLEILFYLCSHRAYGQEICSKFDLHHSTISYHLTKLLDAGFITGELSGSKTYYTADKAGIQRMLDAFAEKIK